MTDSTLPSDAADSSTEGWVSVFEAATDYEADLVRDRLGADGIPAVVHSQRDHAFNLTVTDLARVRVMVPPDRAGEASALVAMPPVSDADLDAQALAADPLAPDAYDASLEAGLDSGAERISFDVPGDAADTPGLDAATGTAGADPNDVPGQPVL